MANLTIFCNKCGAKNPSDSIFCSSCGEKISNPMIQKSERQPSSITIDVLLCQRCGAPIKYMGEMKEKVLCDYCGYTNIVYDRIAAMETILAGIYNMKFEEDKDPLKRELKEHKMREFRKSVEEKNVESFDNIPNFNTVLEYISIKGLGEFKKYQPKPWTHYHSTLAHRRNFWTESILANKDDNAISLHPNLIKEGYYGVKDGGYTFFVDDANLVKLYYYKELNDFITGEYRGKQALGLCFFSKDTLSKAVTIAQIISSYYEYPVKMMITDGPEPLIISTGPIYVAINHNVSKDEMVVAAALAKAGADSFNNGVESLSLLCERTYHDQDELSQFKNLGISSYWRDRIISQSTDQNIRGEWWLENRWKDIIALEKKRFKKYRWYLKPNGLLELQKYKDSLKKSKLPIPSVLNAI